MGQPQPQQHAQGLLQEPSGRLSGRPQTVTRPLGGPAERGQGAAEAAGSCSLRDGGLHQASRPAGQREEQPLMIHCGKIE